MKTPRERNNIDAVIQASVSANYEIYQMCIRDSIQPLGMGGKNESANITPLDAQVHYDKQGVHAARCV